MDKKFLTITMLGVIVISLFGFFTFTSIQASNLNKQYEQAMQHYDEEELEEAIKLLEELLELDPKHVNGRLHLAYAHSLLTQYDQAKSVLNVGIDLLPEEAEFYSLLAEVELLTEEVEEALYVLNKGKYIVNTTALQEQYNSITDNIQIIAERTYMEPNEKKGYQLAWLNSNNQQVPIQANWSLSDDSIAQLKMAENKEELQITAAKIGTFQLTASLEKAKFESELELNIVNEVIQNLEIIADPEMNQLAPNQELALTVEGYNKADELMDIKPVWELAHDSEQEEESLGSLSEFEEVETTFKALKEGTVEVSVSYQDLTETKQFIIINNDELFTVENEGNGEILFTPDKNEIKPSDSVTIVAEPEEGWQFVHWIGDIEGTENPFEFTYNSDIQVIGALFEEVGQHTLSLEPRGNGTIISSPNRTTFNDQEQVNVSATPYNGSNFSHWEGDVNSADREKQHLSIIMNSNKSLTAVFVLEEEATQVEEATEEETEEPTPLQTYTLTLTHSGSGSVHKNPYENQYAAGTTVTVSATAADGWVFKRWVGDNRTSSTISVTMDGDKSLQAVFERKPQTQPELEPEPEEPEEIEKPEETEEEDQNEQPEDEN